MIYPRHRSVPVRLLEVELGEPLGPVGRSEPGSQRTYSRALCLVRLHGAPLGLVPLELGDDAAAFTGDPHRPVTRGEEGLSAEELARRIWVELGPEIRKHMLQDELPEPDSLPAGGLPTRWKPRCLAERDAVRDRACPATVVVATRERPERLRRCLTSLLELDYPDYGIVVVDNAPITPVTRDLVTSEQFASRVTYVREDRGGIAAAHNRGLAHASGSFVAFTDDDVVVDRMWLLELARGFAGSEPVACVTGLIVAAELETPAQLVADRMWRFNKGFSLRVFDHTTDGNDPLYPYAAGTFGSGANMAFNADILRSLGGFDAAIGIGTPARGGDDLSAFFTVIAAGHRLVYNPAALVRHNHCRDYAALKRQAFGYGMGLTAYLTKTVVDRPSRLIEFARLSRLGIARALDPHSGGASPHPPDWPPDLVAVERLGMMQGPPAYLWSRLREGRRRRRFGAPQAGK